ncbi:MAG: hypothetical protein ACRYGP_00550 [Janthinobacterium lividum]
MRHWFRALAASTLLLAASPAVATSPLLANGDSPYWNLNYAKLDTTYEAIDRKARKNAAFRWDASLYCRYRTGWQGAGAYRLGDRFKTRYGWDGGYPWQGPGRAEDHDGDEPMADYRAEYQRGYGHAPVCGAVRHYRHIRREVVLRRKD